MRSILARFIALTAATLVVGSTIACGGSGSTEDATSGEGALVKNQPAGHGSAKDLRFKQLKAGPTDADLKALFEAGSALDNAYIGTYRFMKPKTESTDPKARELRIKETMHKYMCGFFDESIDIGRNTGNKVDAVMKDLDITDNASDEDAKVTAVQKALEKVYANPKLDVLSGSASGNNTLGEIMGVYDTQHNEILYFGFTNCGSDD